MWDTTGQRTRGPDLATLQALSWTAPASPGPGPFSDSLSGWGTITANKVVWVGQGGAGDRLPSEPHGPKPIC